MKVVKNLRQTCESRPTSEGASEWDCLPRVDKSSFFAVGFRLGRQMSLSEGTPKSIKGWVKLSPEQIQHPIAIISHAEPEEGPQAKRKAAPDEN
ncbi:MAG: hypothetical protein ACRD2O_05420 [Terriglobia bacterium]